MPSVHSLHSYHQYYNKREPPFDNTTAVKPFGRGIWGKDDEENVYHVTNGTVSYKTPNDVLAPMLHHNAGPFPALMLNLRFEETRGRAIDELIACSQSRKEALELRKEQQGVRLLHDQIISEYDEDDGEINCGAITDMLILTSQEVEPGPGALIFSPIYPDKDPTEVSFSVVLFQNPPRDVFVNLIAFCLPPSVGGCLGFLDCLGRGVDQSFFARSQWH
jgi:hypothetical protein